jgi:hypothetical protein
MNFFSGRGRGAEHKMEPRDKIIRVRTSTYDKLAELGNILEDYDDIISRLLEEHDEQEEKEQKRNK